MAVEDLGKDLRKLAEMNRDYPTIILENGHGGVINGVYQTSGKRSPIWADGRQLFEGEFNRDIVSRLIIKFKAHAIPFLNLVDTQEDVPLRKRTDDANAFYKKNKNCIYLSIHANAASSDKASGFEIFTSEGQTKSDSIAEIIFEEYKNEFPELKPRIDDEDGDSDKESHFFVLVETLMPSVLIECAFMTCLKPDCEILISEEGRQRIANAIFRGVLKYLEKNN